MHVAPLSSQARLAARATRGFFLICGVGTAAWAPMVPFAKARLGLDDGHLGMLLLCMGLGSTCSMPISAAISHRRGNRILLPVSGLMICLALPLLALAPTVPLQAAALAFFGAGLGVSDVAMNAHAVQVEHLASRQMMSGFHAMYSAGGLVGGVLMTGLLATGASLGACAAVIGVVLALIAVTQTPQLLPDRIEPTAQHRSAFAMPSGLAILIGLMCLILFLAEGAMVDWSAELLTSSRNVAKDNAGLGYAAFSVAMTTGRLLGDRITTALGPVRVTRVGSLVAAAGFVLAAALPWATTSVLGFVLIGIGASNIVPVMFSAAGRLPDTAPSIGIATVTAFGYAGILSGPAAIGFVARATSLPIALACLAALLVMVTASAGVVRRGALRGDSQ